MIGGLRPRVVWGLVLRRLTPGEGYEVIRWFAGRFCGPGISLHSRLEHIPSAALTTDESLDRIEAGKGLQSSAVLACCAANPARHGDLQQFTLYVRQRHSFDDCAAFITGKIGFSIVLQSNDVPSEQPSIS